MEETEVLTGHDPHEATIMDFKLTRVQEQCLRDQAITDEQPGPVLRDFRVLLDFLGPQGVEAGGKYNVLPLKFIGELDRCLSRPLHLELKRPLLRSHPYLQGLNLLLRASGLSRVEAAGAKGRLILDPDMLAQWDRLNPTEQYFNLLEAWLRLGRPEMVGEPGSRGGQLLPSCLQAWRRVPEQGRRIDPENPPGRYAFGVGSDFYMLALMDLFGLLEIEQPRRPVAPWSPAGLRHVAFGDAVFALILSQFELILGEGFPQQDDEDQEEGEPEGLRFGAWQSLFQPYFPEWRQNLVFQRFEPREGTFIFRVSLGKVWRLIAMPADAALDDLVGLILRSVNFDSDHLYKFTYRDRLGTDVSISHPAMDEDPGTDRVSIGTLPLDPGQTMELLYDFGDEWAFTIKLERIDPPGARKKAPRILEKHGKAPKQYPRWDW
ncbi:MAG: plasmid pRiA4b ORF-3 family protein [Isosphaerales bacterium]